MSTSTPTPKRILACIRCGEKRIKCDRLSPCATCIKHNVECEYRARKVRATRSGTRLTANQGYAEHHQARLTLRNNISAVAIEDANIPKTQTISAPINDEIENAYSSKEQITIFKPQLLQSQEGTKLIDNSLWSRITEEASSEADDATKHSTEVVDHQEDVQDFSYILNPVHPSLLKQHPSSTKIHFLWQTFVERVDPMVKILHVPSFQTALEKAIADMDHIPKSFEAIMFSIYSMAILSMTEDECLKSFNESRKTALAFYVGATKMALLQANFMSSTNLVVFQALTLHIFSIRQDHEPRAVWSLTGLALRIAQIIGLFIDGSLLGLSPFETEMRRRLWWQLKHHDSRAAELCGQAKFQLFEPDDKAPRMPANVNDCDISPSMTQIPIDSVRPTEMLWNVLIAELSSFASAHKRKLKELKTSNGSGLSSEEYSALDDIPGKDTISEEIEELMETKHLRFCDPSKPLQLLTLVGSRCATDFIRFVAHHPRRWTQQSNVQPEERQTVWSLCLQILDRVMMMQSMSRLQRFAWIVPYFIQWTVIIHILDTLRMEPLHQEADKAWTLIDLLYELNADILLGMNRPVYRTIGSLCLKAHLARIEATGSSLLDRPVPGYIAELQRNYHKARDNDSNSATTANKDHETGIDLGSLPNGGDDTFWLEFSGNSDLISSDFDMQGFIYDYNWSDISK